MIFKEWFKWIKNVPWSFKWFLLLILIRPVADTFYYIKDTSIILSPPNIIAALTIPLVFLSTTTGKRSGVRSGMSYIDLIVIVWGGLVFMNGVTLFLDLEFLSALETFLRSTIPFAIYLFARVFVRSMQHLYIILLTALFAALIPAVMFLLELIVGPFGTQITRGSIVRYHGLYADIFHYSIYSLFAFLICGYLYMGPGKSKSGQLLSGRRYIFIVLFILVMLLQIAHITTTIIFLTLFLLFIYTNKEINFFKISFITISIGAIIFVLFSDNIQGVVDPMIEREIGILQGEREISQFGHGRVGRIINYQETWNEQPLAAKILGMGFSNIPNKSGWFGGAIHNEYMRSLYTAGVFGFIGYILLLIIGFIKARKFPSPERYLFYGLLIMVVLYSFTMLPMLYYNLLYIFMPALAFLAHTSNMTKKEIQEYL